MRKHVFHSCTDEGCNVCDGGLAWCTVCGAAESELLEECPGQESEEERRKRVQEQRVEALAALAHEQWAGWTRWMLDCLASPTREDHIARWERQMSTLYADLPEREKESDRVEARKVLALLDTLTEQEMDR